MSKRKKNTSKAKRLWKPDDLAKVYDKTGRLLSECRAALDRSEGNPAVAIELLADEPAASSSPEELARLLDEAKDHARRHAAVQKLGEVNDASAIPVLLEAASVSNNKVQRAAIKALGKLLPRVPEAVSSVVEAAIQPKLDRWIGEQLKEAFYALAGEHPRMAICVLDDYREANKGLAASLEDLHRYCLYGLRDKVPPASLRLVVPDLHRIAGEKRSSQVRTLALELIKKAKPRDAELAVGLLAQLDDHDMGVVQAAYEAILAVAPDRGSLVDPLVERLRTWKGYKRHKALQLLVECDVAAYAQFFEKAARDRYDTIRIWAAQHAARLGPGAIDTLVGMIRTDPQPHVRKRALESLVALGADSATELVTLMLRDPDRDVRATALEQLPRLGAEQRAAFLPKLVEMYEHEPTRFGREAIERAIEALQRQGVAVDLDALRAKVEAARQARTLPRLHGRKSKTPTGNVLGPPVTAVFGADAKRHQSHFLPLLSVQLSELQPSWRGQVHFLYQVLNTGQGVTFGLRHEAERSQLVALCEYEGFDEDGLDERDVKQGYLSFVSGKDDEDDYHVAQLGGEPFWWQHDETPTCPECRDIMTFIGQVAAWSCGDELADYSHYLFYCPRCELQTQIDQST